MREILPDLLWTGNASDSRDPRMLLSLGIMAVVDLAMEEPPIVLPRELVYCRFPLVDGQGNPPAMIGAAISTTSTLVAAETPTLIRCSGGMSRSPALAAVVVARIRQIPLDEALKRIAASGPIDVSPRLWNELKSLISGSC